MAEFTDQEIEQARDRATEAGRTSDADALDNELRSRRAKGGQPQTTADTPLAGSAQADPTPPPADDGFADVPTEISGVILTPSMRQMFVEGRQLTDPKEKRLLAARLTGRIAAMSDEGNPADKFATSQTGAALRGIGAGIFGIGDLAAAGGTAIGSDLTFGEALEAQREFRRTLEEEFPGTSLLGEIGGAVISGSAVLKGAQVVAKGTKFAAPLAKATVFSKNKGSKALLENVARASTAGALASGVTEGITEGEILRGVGVGALAGPIGVGLMKAASIPLNAAANLLKDPGSKGLVALAKRLGENPKELAQRFLEFRTVTGKTPSIADIASPQAAAELRELIAQRATAAVIAREGAEATTRTRGGEIAEQIAGGRVTTTAGRQQATRNIIAERQFAEAEAVDIIFKPAQVKNLLSDPDLKRALPATLRRRLDEALDVPENAPVTLTGLDVNDLRKALRDRGRGATGADRVFNELADEVEAIAVGQSPEFERAIAEFAGRSRRAEGIAAGRKAITQRTSEARQAVREAEEEATVRKAPGFAAGVRVGARSELADVAREGASRSARLSRDLAEDSGLVARLRAVLPKSEVDRLQTLGRVQARSAENIRTLAPGIRAEENKAVSEAMRDAVGAFVVAAGNTGGAFKAGIIQRLGSRLTPKLSKRVVNNIARDVFDPDKTEEVIAALRRAELGDAEILDLFATAFISGQQAAESVGQ